MLDTDHLRRTANDMRGSVVHDLLRTAADEIDKLRAKSQPTVWTCEHHEGESFSCPDDAMDGAAPGDWSDLEGWARVETIRATVQPDGSVAVVTI